MADGKSHPQPGDLIEIFRPLYQHWALYVGDGYVIHVTGDGAPSLLGSSSSMSIKKGKVKKELLKEVVGNNKWHVNNKYDRSLKPRPVEKILQRAELWIGEELPYGVLASNCEHFVTGLRYGKRVSDQATSVIVRSFTAGVAGAVSTVLPFAVPAVAAAAIVLGTTGAITEIALSKGL